MDIDLDTGKIDIKKTKEAMIPERSRNSKEDLHDIQTRHGR